jgi:hypothetical protein
MVSDAGRTRGQGEEEGYIAMTRMQGVLNSCTLKMDYTQMLHLKN